MPWLRGLLLVVGFAASSAVVAQLPVCNANPDHRTVNLTFTGLDTSPFRERLANDAAFRASVGNLVLGEEYVQGAYARLPATFDKLADPRPIVDTLLASGYFLAVGYSFGPTCPFPVCPNNPYVDAVEFRRSDRDRYIFVTDSAEREALDDGRIAGWVRTGEGMRVLIEGARTAGDAFHPVYRFWGGSVVYEPSHFFTASQEECAVLRDRPEWNWTYERSGFWAYEWGPTGCPLGIPLYRTYNNSLDGAPAHRYSTKRSVIDEMVARGWFDEGPVMCVAGP
jgi:hypothetical protein